MREPFPHAREKLPANRAELWVARPDEIADPALLEAYYGLMSLAERKRHARFVFAHDRHRFLVTRALVRMSLSRYAVVEPQDWVFSENSFGRPEIASPASLHRIRFNVSHTHGLIVCLCCRDREIGVDVENTSHYQPSLALAERFFSPAEVTALRRLPLESRLSRFFEYWTLKESYVKARGMGLSLSLQQFSFDVESAKGISVEFDDQIDDSPSMWQFGLQRLTSCHLLAYAVRSTEGTAVELRVRDTVPLKT